MKIHNDHVRLAVIGSLLIVSVSVAYYLVIFLPEQQRASVERQRVIDEQLQRDRIFRNELECRGQYDKLRTQFNNVTGVYYSRTLETCMVTYTDDKRQQQESAIGSFVLQVK